MPVSMSNDIIDGVRYCLFIYILYGRLYWLRLMKSHDKVNPVNPALNPIIRCVVLTGKSRD
jgi:hypothetical protein